MNTASQEESQPAGPSEPAKRHWFWLAVGAAALAAVFYFGLGYVVESFTHESTDDAFIESSVVAVAPKIAGQVAAVLINDNQSVTQGQALVEIEPRDYETKLAQKRASTQTSLANRDAAEAGVRLMTTKVATAETSARQAQADLETAKAAAKLAEANLRRDRPLVAAGILSTQDFEVTLATAEEAGTAVESARQKLAVDESLVNESRDTLGAIKGMLGVTLAQIQQSQVNSESAELDLSYTRVLAPTAGRVTRKAVEAGDYVQIGQSLLALVPSNQWIVANFKETQLAHIRPGLPARLRVDAHPGREYRGHVDSIQAGSGARFSLLPPENAVGNYVKVVQRVPVKIYFDEPLPPELSLGPGMSVVPLVVTGEFTVSPGWRAAIAAGLAVLLFIGIGWFLARANADAPQP